jgi:hypothetical protein
MACASLSPGITLPLPSVLKLAATSPYNKCTPHLDVTKNRYLVIVHVIRGGGEVLKVK